MKNVVVYEVQNRPAIKTDLLVCGGLTLCYRKRNTYGDVYYIGDGMLVINETPACCRNIHYFVIRNGERSFVVESLNTPIVIPEGEGFIGYLRSLNEKVELWTAYGLWYVARFLFTEPHERKKFEEFMTKEPYDKYYIWYYYSAYIDKDSFLMLIDKVKDRTKQIADN